MTIDPRPSIGRAAMLTVAVALCALSAATMAIAASKPFSESEMRLEEMVFFGCSSMLLAIVSLKVFLIATVKA